MRHTPIKWQCGAFGDGKAFVQVKEFPYTGEGEEMALANPKYARLIASAPELLEAARDALHRIETDTASYPKDVELIKGLRAAIARAEGE